MPPLRTNKDNKALIKALKDGTIDIISTDHSPQDQENKKIEFDEISSDKIEVLKEANYTNLMKSAIRNSDAIIKGAESLNPELEEEINSSDKPVLEYKPVEEFTEAYLEFYQNH